MLKVFISYLMALLWGLFTKTNFTILPSSFFADTNNVCYGLNLQYMMTVEASWNIAKVKFVRSVENKYTLSHLVLLANIRWWLTGLHKKGHELPVYIAQHSVLKRNNKKKFNGNEDSNWFPFENFHRMYNVVLELQAHSHRLLSNLASLYLRGTWTC